MIGTLGYNYTFEIEMTEPRFEKLDYLENVLTPKVFTIAPKLQGFKYPKKYPIKYGSSGNDKIIPNNGSSQVVPNVKFDNLAQNLRIKTDKGVFSYGLEVLEGQGLVLDINNQTANIDGIDFSGYCTGWEALVLDIGDNHWTIQGEGFSINSLLTVSFFEKFNSL